VSAVQSWRRIAIIGMLAWIIGVAVWVYRPWNDVVTLEVPKGSPPQSVSYSCGRLVGTSEVKPSETRSPPPIRWPTSRARPAPSAACLGCSTWALGVVALFVLLTRFSIRQAEAAPAP